MTRVYVAGPSAELARVREAVSLVEGAGHYVTERWFDKIEADRGSLTSDEGVPDETLARAWEVNLYGVRRAEVLVLLAKTGGGLSNGTREEVSAFTSDPRVSHRIAIVGSLGSSPLCGWLRWASTVYTRSVRIVPDLSGLLPAMEALR